MPNNPVEARGLKKTYTGRGAEAPALRGVDFFAGENSVTGIIGANGAGKSTLLRIICGLLYPTEGEISVRGFSELHEIRRRVALVPESPALDKSMTAAETLVFEAELFGAGRAEALDMARKAADECALSGAMHKKAGELSRGFQQRLSLARALCRDPEVLALDEFSSGLDPAQSRQIKGIIREAARSRTVILSTHNMEEASDLCGMIFIMDSGRMAASGTVGQILAMAGAKTLGEAFLRLAGGER